MLGTLAEAMPPFPFNGWAATDAYAQSHSSVLVDFLKAHLLKLLNPPLPAPNSFFDNRYALQAVAELARQR